MHSEFSSTKLKQQPRRDTTSHLATYQGEVIRKSICNDHTQSQHPHPHPHSKVTPPPCRKTRTNTRIG
jgi:hypothetical protein